MAEPILSYELKSLINKIKQQYVVEFPIQIITPNYLLLAMIEEKSCDAYNVISKLMMDSTINEFKQYVIDRIMIDGAESMKQNDKPEFSDVYDRLAGEIMDSGASLVTSSLMLNSIINNDPEIVKQLTRLGVTPDQVNDTVIAYNTTANVNNKEIKANKWNRKKTKSIDSDSGATTLTIDELNKFLGKTGNTQPSRVIPNENNIVETNCKNLVRIASTGAYDNLIGYDDIIDKIFNIFSKYERNTVAIVGPSGVGKTTIVNLLAKRIYEQNCPKQFRDKYVMEFGDTITSLIVKEMVKMNKYIGFIDKAENMFANKENEANTYMFLTELFKTQSVCTIFTMNENAYAKYVKSKPDFERLVNKIEIKVPDDELLFDIVKTKSEIYEDYNNVSFSDECINESIRLAKRFITNENCPASALNIIDTTGAYVRMKEGENETIRNLRQRLNEIEIEKNSIPNSSSAEEFDRKDQLIREEIRINNEINQIENRLNNSNQRTEITVSDIRVSVSQMLNIPLTELDDDERRKLKTLSDNLRSVVIGQDEAIEDITRAVRRQRVGLSNPNKPIVMLFVGTTGVGKCVCGDTIVKIRNKKTNEIQEITLNELKKLRLTQQN